MCQIEGKKLLCCCGHLVPWLCSVGQIQDFYACDSQAPILYDFGFYSSQGITVMAGKGQGPILHAGPYCNSHSPPFNMSPPWLQNIFSLTGTGWKVLLYNNADLIMTSVTLKCPIMTIKRA